MAAISQQLDYSAKWAEGLDYHAFLDRHGSEDQRRRWAGIHGQIRLTDAQRDLLAGFRRDMKVFCLSGTWCGDCANQCPIFDHFAAASPRIAVRYFDRDTHPDLAVVTQICGAARVPAVLFVSEDDYPCGLYGDRTLAKYRDMGATLSGAACATGIALGPSPLQAEVVSDWLREFERIQWMLRTSARLRQKHGD